MSRCRLQVAISAGMWLLVGLAVGAEPPRTYENRWTPIAAPQPILADYPEFVEPIRETARFEAPPLVEDEGADLAVRAWRFSYNARAILEIPNRLDGEKTAIIVVHPWGIDDGWGWMTPQPAGVAFQCTPEKNAMLLRHVKEVVHPFLERLRPQVRIIAYSLPGREDPMRKRIYRSIRGRTTAAERERGTKELEEKLRSFRYEGEDLPRKISLGSTTPVADYFRQFPGLDAGSRYNGAGFWDLPIPVTKEIRVDLEDVAIYDAEGYPALRDFLKGEGIRNVLLAGYNTDMCYCLTTAGYKNLSPDFNVFLVGDASIATSPANPTARFATNAHLSFAALSQLVTQVSWVQLISKPASEARAR